MQKLRLSEDEADASIYVGILRTYKIFLQYMCCAFVGLDNKLDKMVGTHTEKKTR